MAQRALCKVFGLAMDQFARLRNDQLPLRRIVTENRRQPAFHFRDFHLFARGLRVDLVFADGADGEVMRVFVREVDCTHRCRSIDGETFCGYRWLRRLVTNRDQRLLSMVEL